MSPKTNRKVPADQYVCIMCFAGLDFYQGVLPFQVNMQSCYMCFHKEMTLETVKYNLKVKTGVICVKIIVWHLLQFSTYLGSDTNNAFNEIAYLTVWNPIIIGQVYLHTRDIKCKYLYRANYLFQFVKLFSLYTTHS